MKTKIFIIFTVLLFTSCATIPIQSVELMDNVQIEGERMHKLNVSLINQLFDQKQNAIDEFIIKKYIPEFSNNLVKKIPENTDLQEELPNILSASLPEITQRRDLMQSTLEKNRRKIIEKLNADYYNYKDACDELSNLLKSAVRISDEKIILYKKTKEISKNQIDFENLENTLDQFIYKSGDWSEKINNLNESINTIIKN